MCGHSALWKQRATPVIEEVVGLEPFAGWAGLRRVHAPAADFRLGQVSRGKRELPDRRSYPGGSEKLVGNLRGSGTCGAPTLAEVRFFEFKEPA